MRIRRRLPMRILLIASLSIACIQAFVLPSQHVRPIKTRDDPLKISLDDSWNELVQVVDPKGLVSTIDLQTLEDDLRSIEWEKLLVGEVQQIEKVASTLWEIYSALPLWEEVSLVFFPLFTFLLGTLYSLSHPEANFRDGYDPYATGNYDPIQARVYYSKHPIIVLQRTLQLLRISNRYIFNLLVDKYIFRDENRQRAKRANELLTLINQAGPTAIKVGQALSVRQDLIPVEYAEVLSTLQDRVPPFASDEAKTILRKELGIAKYSKLKDLYMEKGPVASASIGQVYKGYAGETEVAVKIQRPNALAEIALDLYLVREFAPIYRKLTRSATDLQGLADEWGRVFISELDYNLEAKNTMRFNQEMKKRKLDAVTAPVVVEEYTTQKVLTTEWVTGTRLDQSDADDVPRLCSVALNAYLLMLLELQSLHCDPHPGNLLRTQDGKLCILDFGMTLETDKDLQYSLLEFVSHLTSEDYDQVPDDLVKLGFLRADKLESVRSSGYLEPLTYFLKQANKGGGAEKVRERIFEEFRERYPGFTDDELRVQMRADMRKQIEEARKRESAVTGVTVQVEELQKRNRDAFSIPEWFLYTSRAFLTLEGVSLQADENFSIIQSCFPYVAKRLLGDDSPRSQKALRDLLYGASNAVDVNRLADLAEGFFRYTSTTKTIAKKSPSTIERNGLVMVGEAAPVTSEGALDTKAKVARAEAAITLAKDSADILLAPGGNLVQNLLVEESALAASAGVKDAVQNAFFVAPRLFRDSLPLGLGTVLPPLPLEESFTPFLKKTREEEKAQSLFTKLSSIASKSSFSTVFPGNENGSPGASSFRPQNDIDLEQAALVAKELRESIPRYVPLVGQLGGKFASKLLKTASMNIDTTLKDIDQHDTPEDQLVKAAARRLSNAASRGAEVLSSQLSISSSESKDIL